MVDAGIVAGDQVGCVVLDADRAAVHREDHAPDRPRRVGADADRRAAGQAAQVGGVEQRTDVDPRAGVHERQAGDGRHGVLQGGREDELPAPAERATAARAARRDTPRHRAHNHAAPDSRCTDAAVGKPTAGKLGGRGGLGREGHLHQRLLPCACHARQSPVHRRRGKEVPAFQPLHERRHCGRRRARNWLISNAYPPFGTFVFPSHEPQLPNTQAELTPAFGAEPNRSCGPPGGVQLSVPIHVVVVAGGLLPVVTMSWPLMMPQTTVLRRGGQGAERGPTVSHGVVGEDAPLLGAAGGLAADHDDPAHVIEGRLGNVRSAAGQARDLRPGVRGRVVAVHLSLRDLLVLLPVLPADDVEEPVDRGRRDVVAAVGQIRLLDPAGGLVVEVQRVGRALVDRAGLVHPAGEVDRVADQGGGPRAAGCGRSGPRAQVSSVV